MNYLSKEVKILGIKEVLPTHHSRTNGHTNGTNHIEQHLPAEPAINISETPAFLVWFEKWIASLTIEEIVELSQGRGLELALQPGFSPYHHEEGADQISEGRRLSVNDTVNKDKLSDKEVKRYKQLKQMIIESGNTETVLQELFQRWITPQNVGEIARHLRFKRREVTVENRNILENPPINLKDQPDILGEARKFKWYQLMMEAFSESNTIPLVLILDLLDVSRNRPTFHNLISGLKNYYARETQRDIRRNDPLQTKIDRPKVYSTEQVAEIKKVFSTFYALTRRRLKPKK